MVLLRTIGLLVLITLLGGCSATYMNSFGHNVRGDYYLSNKKYDQGLQRFAAEVDKCPESATANYYYGRFLLINGDYPPASLHLAQAADLDADNPDYQFWSGVAYGALGVRENEEASYRRALELDTKHLQSIIYLGHVEFRKKEYEKALALYDRSLKIWPASPESLYNRSLIFHIQGRSDEEHAGWQRYLSIYPSGPHSRLATEYLNLLEDFSFRNYRIGPRTVTVEKISFRPLTGMLEPSSFASLKLIGKIHEKRGKGTLQVLVYQKDDRDLARERALSIRRYLLDTFPGIEPEMIGVSWFSEPHFVEIKGKKLTLEESVSFFVT